MSPETVDLIRDICLVLFCLGGITPSAIQIIRYNRRNR